MHRLDSSRNPEKETHAPWNWRVGRDSSRVTNSKHTERHRLEEEGREHFHIPRKGCRDQRCKEQPS